MGAGQASQAPGPKVAGEQRFMPASDTDYLSAVKKGDTVKAQQMVDEAAKVAGYTIGPVYHGTPTGGFNVFDKKMRGETSGVARQAFSFTTNKQAAESYSKRLDDEAVRLDAGLRVANDAMRMFDEDIAAQKYFTSKGFTSVNDRMLPEFDWGSIDDVPEFIEELRGYAKDLKPINKRLSDNFIEAAKVMTSTKAVPEVKRVFLRIPEGAPVFKATPETLGQVMSGFSAENQPTRAGIVELPGNERIYYVADSSQVKLVDAVTKDSEGKVIPLSQRFQKVSEDIRYMPTDTEYLTAVKQGDTKVVQRMVDKAAKAAGYTSKVFHGSSSNFTKPNTPLFLGDEGMAATYAQNRAMMYGEGAEPVMYRLYGKFNKTASEYMVKQVAQNMGFEVENDMAFSVLDPQISPGKSSRLIQELKKRGYDSAKINDFSADDATKQVQSIVAFDPSQLKFADPITKDNAGNVIPLSQRFKATSSDIRYMPASDTDYLSAVKKGDTATAQRMVDEAAKAAGYDSDILKHGSRQTGFTTFNFERNREQPFTNGKKPWFFAENEGTARTYGPNIGDYRLRVERPLEIHEIVGRDSDGEYQREAFMREDAYQALSEDIRALLEEAKDGEADTDSLVREMLASGEAVGSYAKAFRKWGSADNDGMIAYDTLDTMGPGDRDNIHIVFDPSQIKSADPITRDDQGNVIPLSQRFKATSSDIRYMPQPDAAMPGAYSFTGGYRALPGKAKGSLRLYGPAGSLVGIASSLDEAQRILRRKTK